MTNAGEHKRTTTMKPILKKLDMGNTVTRITVEHNSSDSANQHDEIIALAILMGGYNKFGRSIDVEKYQEIKQRFNDCIDEIKDLLK